MPASRRIDRLSVRDRRSEGGTVGAGMGEKKGQGGWGVYGLLGRQEANCALMMALCEINQTQPCPFSLYASDKGLICAGWSGWGAKRNLNHPTPLAE